MKLILDARKIDDFGIGEYIKTVFSKLAADKRFEAVIITPPGKNTDIFSNSGTIPAHSKNYSLFEHFEIPLKTIGLKDFTYFSPHYIFPWTKIKDSIVTVHDLIHFKFPEYFKPGIKVNVAEKFIKKVRDHSLTVFTVSRNTKKDLIEMFDFRDEKIRVVQNGLNEIFFSYKKGNKPPLKTSYILYTGNIKPHKNVGTLVEAFRIIHSKFPDLRLVLAGAGNKLSEELMHDDIKEYILTTGYLEREELIDYIDHSEFFVFPSLYEGFGFPPLEAMSRGKAVISSSGGSLKEILGDASLYFNPYSPVELAEKMELFLKKDNIRKEYEERGRVRALKFNIDNSIKKYKEILLALKK